MKVTAAVLRAHDQPFSIERLELNGPRADEVVVRLVATGLCHTDLLARELPAEYFTGPVVCGHEGAGVVEAVGADVTTVAIGDHVALSFDFCGRCSACSGGHPAYCSSFAERNGGKRLDGTSAFSDGEGAAVRSHFFGQSSFASHTAAAARSVIKINPSYDLNRVGPLGCGIQTGAGAVFNSFRVKEGESLVVAGSGSLGLAAIMAAKIAGAREIIAIDRHSSRLTLAVKYGATATLIGSPAELTAGIKDLTGGGADYCFDTTGNARVIRALHDGLGPWGRLGLCGVGFGEVTFDMVTMLSGRSIFCIIEGDATPREFIPRLLELNAQGLFPYDELITTFPLEEINLAEAASVSGEVIKPVLTFAQDGGPGL